MLRKYRGKNEGTHYQFEIRSLEVQTSHKDEWLSYDIRFDIDARHWLREVRSDIDHSHRMKGGSILLCHFLENWLAQHRHALREKTAHQYSSIINNHINNYLGQTAIKDLNLMMIENYYSWLQESKVGVRTIQIIHNILHASLDKAVKYGVIRKNPTQGATLPVYHFDEMHILNKDQVKLLLAVASEYSSYAFYRLALTTGMRMGELLGLKWSDINWESGSITIQRQKQYVPGLGCSLIEPKTRFGRRTIKIGESTLRILVAHRITLEEKRKRVCKRWVDMDLIFPNAVGRPGDASNIRLEFNALLEQAGISRIRFHDLRHTTASILLNQQIPVIVVSRILGHSRPSVTLDLYGHVLCDMQDEAAKVMENVLAPCQ